MVKRQKRITDINILRPFYEQYKEKKITLDKFAKSIHVGERQARRNFKKFCETNEIPILRGYGSKKPYDNEDDCIKVFEMAYKGTTVSEIKSTFSFKDRKAYRHYNILSHLSKHFDCVISEDNKTCTFTIFVECNCVKDKAVCIVITIDLIEKIIVSREISIVAKRDLPIDGSEIPEYYRFVEYMIKQIVKTYFKKLKMREMLDRLDDKQRIEKLKNYFTNTFSNLDQSELCSLILNIKSTLFLHTNNNINLAK